LGLFVGGLAAFGFEYLDDTFKVPEDIETTLRLPVLGIIPSVESADKLATALANPQSALSEAYRSLRTALQFSTADGAPRTLLVTSARAGEGKSTTALSLAKNFAQLGQRVLLIDADLRNPSLHRELRLKNDHGLSNYLTGNALPTGVFQKAEQPGLTVMTSGRIPPNPAELLAGPKMASLLTVAAEKFDILVIDGPPVMGIADAPLLASVASATMLVVEAGVTRRGVTKAALKRLHFARAQMIGAIISKFNARRVGYGYSYGYGYGYSYGYGDDYYGYGSQALQLETESPTVPAEKGPEDAV
jgi:capsular exopolysaccharide synthesis family protein